MLAPQLWSRKGSGRFWVKRDESSRSRSPSDVRLAPRATMIATQYVAKGHFQTHAPQQSKALRALAGNRVEQSYSFLFRGSKYSRTSVFSPMISPRARKAKNGTSTRRRITLVATNCAYVPPPILLSEAPNVSPWRCPTTASSMTVRRPSTSRNVTDL